MIAVGYLDSLAAFFGALLGCWYILLLGAPEMAHLLSIVPFIRQTRCANWVAAKLSGPIPMLLFMGAFAAAAFFAFHEERRERLDFIRSLAIDSSRMFLEPNVVYNVNGINGITAYVILVNRGKTTANSVRWKVGVKVLESEAGAGPFDWLGEMQLSGGPDVFGPGRSDTPHVDAEWPPEPKIREEMVKEIISKRKSIFVFGELNWTDELGRKWTSRSCRMYAGYEMADNPNDPARKNKTYLPNQSTPCPNEGSNYGPRQVPEP